jgi:hypothetical protein
MPSVKDKLLEDIEVKAQKIRERRVRAASYKTVETLAFEFFQRCDEAKQLAGVGTYAPAILSEAMQAMQTQLRMFDNGAKMRVEWQDGQIGPGTGTIRGVTIVWSSTYYILNKVEPTIYIDIGQMLLA